MGPTLLLDKSSLQALNPKEVMFLYKHYTVVIPPILIFEIVADLKKKTEEESEMKRLVSILAKKLSGLDSSINVDYRTLLLANLFGQEIHMQRLPLVAGAQLKRTRMGKEFIFVDEDPVMEVIQNWQQGVFSPREETFAEVWRTMPNEVGIEEFKQQARNIVKGMHRPKNISELSVIVDSHISDPEARNQMMCLSSMLGLLVATQGVRDAVFRRWHDSRSPQLEKFAPYAWHCFRASYLAHFAMVLDFVPTLSTNLFDLEYLFYSPFCMVFSSGDRFLARLAPEILGSDQTFVHSDDLKGDLKWLVDEWEGLGELEKHDRALNFGSYPPLNPESLAHRLWQRYMRPWKPGSGNRAIAMTPDEEQKLLEHLRPFMDAVDSH